MEMIGGHPLEQEVRKVLKGGAAGLRDVVGHVQEERQDQSVMRAREVTWTVSNSVQHPPA
jgi:hypothetical protein